MTFKIKDGIRIGTVDVFNNVGVLQVPAPSVTSSLTAGTGLTGGPYNGSGAITLNHSNSVTAGTAEEGGITRTLGAGGTFNIPSITYDANGHITGKGSIALTLPNAISANDGTFALSIGTAASTNTTISIGTGTGFSANASSNLTYDIKVGPALTNLATLMTTAGAGFIKRGAVADTYTIDTTTYLSGTVAIGSGGTNITTYAAGDILYASATNVLSKLAKGADGQVLKLATGLPVWSADNNTTYTAASASTLGLIKIEDDTVQTTAANAVSTTASRTYGIQLNATGQAVVNIPWTDTAETDTLQTVTGRGASSNVTTINLSAATTSTTTANGTLVVGGGVGIAGALNIGGATTVGGSLTVTGDLTVNGTTTTINTATITVDDKNIELGSVTSPTNTTADGGGITLKGSTDKTFNWINSTGFWTANVGVSAPTLVSTVTTGTSPLTVTSTTLVNNLNADLLDGNQASAFYLATNPSGYTSNTGTVTAVNSGNGMNFTNFSTTGTVTLGTPDTLTNATANAVTASSHTHAITGFSLDSHNHTLDSLSNTTITSNSAGEILKWNGSAWINNTLAEAGILTAEVDTLQTVISRGNTTTTDVQLNGSSLALAPATTAKIWKKAVTSTLSTNTATAVDTWAIATYRSAKYFIQATQGSKYYSAEVNVIHDGTTAYITEFAVLENTTMSWGATSWSATIATGTLTLAATITDASTTNVVFQIERTLFAV